MRVAEIWALSIIGLGSLISGPRAWADGRCTYTQESPHGTHDVCEMPVTAENCDAMDEWDSVSDPGHASGACPTDDVVGTCDKGSTQIIYYSGEPDKLEIGCGFQGGTWLNGYANP